MQYELLISIEEMLSQYLNFDKSRYRYFFKIRVYLGQNGFFIALTDYSP